VIFMALVTVDELLERAEKGGYAVGAFNANNMEIVQAIMTAAEKEQAPVIMQASQGAIKYAGLTFLTGLVKLAAESSRVPIALHLDHGTDFEQVIRCIRSGFRNVRRIQAAPGRKYCYEQKSTGNRPADRGLGRSRIGQNRWNRG
jgi:fructose-bisphosphate aldolase class II